MLLRRLVILLLLLVGVRAAAQQGPQRAGSNGETQYSDEQLFRAYLASDMQTWKEYIDHACFDSLTTEEQQRLVYYEYGYAAALLDVSKKAAKPYIRQFGEHLQAMAGVLPEVLEHVYTAAWHTYELAVTSRKIVMHGRQIFEHAEQAVATDSDYPLAWSLLANVHFYAPRAMGGSKRLAMREYERADSLYAVDSTAHEQDWTWVAQMVNLAQCYDKLGMKDNALRQAEAIPQRWPDFEYIKQYIEKLKLKIKN